MKLAKLNFTQRILLAMMAAIAVGLVLQFCGQGAVATKYFGVCAVFVAAIAINGRCTANC